MRLFTSQNAKIEASAKRAVAAAERTIREQREDEGGDFVGERGIRLASEGRDLRTLHRVEQSELRFDDARLRLIAAELRADGAMKLDEVLDGEIANAALSVSPSGRSRPRPGDPSYECARTSHVIQKRVAGLCIECFVAAAACEIARGAGLPGVG